MTPNMPWLELVLFVLGIFTLGWGGDLLVKGAADLAARWKIPSLVIGLTVVAFGTSAPEMAVSTIANLGGKPDIAMGNVLGSNMFNVLFVLGVSALFAPLLLSKKVVRFDVPLMIFAGLLAYFFALNGKISNLEGAFLFVSLITYVTYLIIQGRKDGADHDAPSMERPMWLNIIYVFGGLALLVLGSDWFVEGAVSIARLFEINERVIGLTIVAGGTSLPEVAASLAAGLRGQRDIAVGNVIGSNLFNTFGVLGFASLFSPDGLLVSPEILNFDFIVMLGVLMLCYPIFFTHYKVSRREGVIFLSLYLFYTAWIVLKDIQSPKILDLSFFGLWVLLPVITLIMLHSMINHWSSTQKTGKK